MACYCSTEGNVNQIFELHIWTFFSDEDIVIAQHDFQPASESDLQFKKGDRLKIIKEWVNNTDTFW